MTENETRLPLLTISIPTYNRARYLQFQLGAIMDELVGLAGQVNVFVSDNASTDETSEVLAYFALRMPELTFVRKPQNEGPDANISFCYFHPQTPFVWVMGDDDAPLSGSLGPLVEALKSETPDLTYLPSIPTRAIQIDHGAHQVTLPRAAVVTREDFGHLLHVQMTFISGLVLRKDAVSQANVSNLIKLTDGTHLIQLAWIYERLINGSSFVVYRDPMLIATAANSGGYSIVKVFFVNHSRVVRALLPDSPSLAKSILSQTALCFLPGLIWNVRTGNIGSFNLDKRSNFELPSALTRSVGYRALVVPIWASPKLLAGIMFLLSRVVGYAVRRVNSYAILSRRRQVGRRT